MKNLIRPFSENVPATTLALITFGIHLAVNAAGGYGYFRDEFYYIACSNHLAWGYVDHPSLSIVILYLNRFLLGDSVFAMRLLPALAAAGLVFITGIIVHELGGGKSAQFLATLGVAIAPVYLATTDFYSMNAFEPLFWMGAAYILIRILNTGNQKLWIWFGIIVGLGAQNKHSMLFFCFAMLAGLLFTVHRRQFISKWFWFGGVIAGVLFLPNILWQIYSDWATLTFMQNAQQWKNAPMSPLEFISAQVLFQHPLVAPLWITGVLVLLFNTGLKKYRFAAFAFLILFVLFIVQRGKPYYLSPFYPVLLAAGAVAIEQFVTRKNIRWLSQTYAVFLIAGGLITLPAFLPVLPVEFYARYVQALGLQAPKLERHADTELPQVFADRFGWREMTTEVAAIYHSLTPEEQRVAAIYTQNYGEAGAIDFFGSAYGLPNAICGHNSYWEWELRGYSGEVLIIIGGDEDDHREVYESVTRVATHSNPYAMPFETNIPIFVCRRPKIPLKDIWNDVRHFI